MNFEKMREEKDTMGVIRVPSNALYGAQTMRAVENFRISGLTLDPLIIHSLAMIKKAAALANTELGLFEKKLGDAISASAQEVIEGKLDSHFVVDVFQTGSGTSTNMNVNEVIANRANQILGFSVGNKYPVHPNDHVNRCQSSNDIIPSAIQTASLIAVTKDLVPSVEELVESFRKKEQEFDSVIKIGRTHLQDATPVTLGQEFSAFRKSLENNLTLIKQTESLLATIPIGGTAVGTGMNVITGFPEKTLAHLNRISKLNLKQTDNTFNGLSQVEGLVNLSGALKTLAVSLMKIANDMRWLSSGPRCGLSELILPAVQPGSSIMPGKVNPVILESVCQVAAQIMGNDLTITIAGQSGNFQLNTMFPVIGHNIIQSLRLMTTSCSNLKLKCIDNIKPDIKSCEEKVEKSLALATPLAAVIGYDRASEIAYKAFREGKTIRKVCEEDKILDPADLKKILDVNHMI